MIAVLVLLASCGGDDGSSGGTTMSPTSEAATTSTAAPSSTSTTTTILSLPPDLQGTWSAGETTVTLDDCAAGEECGRLERIDENGEHCFYTLSYIDEDAIGFNLQTGKGHSFGCAWSGWSNAIMHLTPATDDTIDIVAIGAPQTAITLTRDS
jgi:hypothetical protein